MASDAQKSFHGIAARLDRLPISGFHMKIMWLLAGITFCDSVDMSIGGPIGAVLQDEGFMTLEQFAFFNSITMIGYLIGGLGSGLVSDRMPFHHGYWSWRCIPCRLFCLD